MQYIFYDFKYEYTAVGILGEIIQNNNHNLIFTGKICNGTLSFVEQTMTSNFWN